MLTDLVQRKPELVEHPTEPQMQVASLGVVPSVLVQSGAVRQRQGLSEEHDLVEAVYVFNQRVSPLEEEMHPAGQLPLDDSYAVVSLNPTLFAASPHIALSRMVPLPVTELHISLVTSEK